MEHKRDTFVKRKGGFALPSFYICPIAIQTRLPPPANLFVPLWRKWTPAATERAAAAAATAAAFQPTKEMALAS
jgi:hypothetical protein